MRLSTWRVAALLVLPALSAYAAVCHAAETNHTVDSVDCSTATSQIELEQCATAALNRADAELNQTYVDYRNQLDRERQDQIRDVQLAWIKYRDLSCKYATSRTGGSAHGLAMQTCLSDKTLQRTQELKALATCHEGDLSCPR